MVFFVDIINVSLILSIKHDKATLSYFKYGSGPSVVLAFHGFGQTHVVFEDLAKAMGEQYTIFSIDLFFHGKSKWGYGEAPLEKSFWKAIMETFLQKEEIERFGVMGFSMGGKFLLACLEEFSSKVESITLLAPDGIKTSFWYSLATYPLLFRRLFKSMIDHPGRFYGIAKVAHTFKLIDKGILRFVESQMNTHEKRERVYLSWVVFRHFKFKTPAIAQIINFNGIPVTLVIGSHDKIITAKNMKPLLSKLPHAKLHVMESGHNNVISAWARANKKP